MKAAVAIAIALSACERADSSGADPGFPKATVTLRDPGSEPRTAIRSHLRAGEHARCDVSTQMTDERFHRDLPSLAYSCEIFVVDVSDGVTHLRERVTSSRDHVLDGATFDLWHDSRGATVRPETSTVARSWRPEPLEMHLIDPAEPVGTGARWREAIESGSTTASSDCTLVSRDGDHVHEVCSYRLTASYFLSPIRRSGVLDVQRDLGTLRASFDETDYSTIRFPDGTARGRAKTHGITTP